MKDFLDRQPTQAGRRLLTYEDGTSEYVTVSMADEPLEEGTPLNRAAFLALQGVAPSSVTVTKSNNKTTITETNAENEKTVTTVTKSSGKTTIKSTFTNQFGAKVVTTTTISKTGGTTSITKEVTA